MNVKPSRPPKHPPTHHARSNRDLNDAFLVTNNVIDFGTVPTGAVYEYSLILQNISHDRAYYKTLQIAATSSNCVAVQHRSNRVSPGLSDTVTVSIMTTDIGSVKSTLSIITETMVIRLPIIAKVINVFEYESLKSMLTSLGRPYIASNVTFKCYLSSKSGASIVSSLDREGNPSKGSKLNTPNPVNRDPADLSDEEMEDMLSIPLLPYTSWDHQKREIVFTTDDQFPVEIDLTVSVDVIREREKQRMIDYVAQQQADVVVKPKVRRAVPFIAPDPQRERGEGAGEDTPLTHEGHHFMGKGSDENEGNVPDSYRAMSEDNEEMLRKIKEDFEDDSFTNDYVSDDIIMNGDGEWAGNYSAKELAIDVPPVKLSLFSPLPSDLTPNAISKIDNIMEQEIMQLFPPSMTKR